LQSSPIGDLLGAHVSTAGGVHAAPRRAAVLPARAFQIFTRNQNRWVGKPLSGEVVAAWFDELAAHGLHSRHVCSHDSYLVNLAATSAENLTRSRAAFVDEIQRCARLEIPYLVWHPGSHLGRGETAGIAAVAQNADRCLEEAAAGPVPGTENVLLCIETTAGQGTNLGWRFEHLRDIIAASRYPERYAVTVDTCHVHAAGYDIVTPAGWRRTLTLLDTAVGLQRVKVLHLNDSRREQGSRIDRHARIGRGAIGTPAFGTIIRTRRLHAALMILEVPGGEPAYTEDLALLRSMKRKDGGHATIPRLPHQ